jgi:hypothetical protein
LKNVCSKSFNSTVSFFNDVACLSGCYVHKTSWLAKTSGDASS